VGQTPHGITDVTHCSQHCWGLFSVEKYPKFFASTRLSASFAASISSLAPSLGELWLKTMRVTRAWR